MPAICSTCTNQTHVVSVGGYVAPPNRRIRRAYRGRTGGLLIDGFRFVISYQQEQRCYLRCARFRHNCRARAIQNKTTGQVQLRQGTHNHNQAQQQRHLKNDCCCTNAIEFSAICAFQSWHGSGLLRGQHLYAQ